MAQALRGGEDHWKVLGLERGASEEEVKKAYRKLALQLHPDKCSVPHANTAFQSVGRAYAVLSNPDKRSAFERYGHEDGFAAAAQQQRARGGGGGATAFHRGGEADAAEELFRAFFGGGIPGGFSFHAGGPRGFHYAHGGHPAQRRPQQQQPQQPPEGLWGIIQQLQPLLLLFLFIVLPAMLGSGPEPASLQRSSTHSVPMQSVRRSVTYYVPDRASFEQRYPSNLGARQRLERELESLYGDRLARRCEDEMRLEQWGRSPRGSPKRACNELRERYSDVWTI